MWYADRVGLDRVYDRVCEFHRQFAAPWEPAPLLEQLATQGRTFSDFQAQRGAAA
jgi:3-hydroxyacyl-CoA dehydrogenase